MLSTGAFNALLKTLEEPPANVIFILATTEPTRYLQRLFQEPNVLTLNVFHVRRLRTGWHLSWTRTVLNMRMAPLL